MPFGVVAGADERAGFDMAEAQRFAERFIVAELLRRNPACDGQVVARGLKVLPNRQNVARG